MRSRIVECLAVLVGIAMLFGVGCSGKPSRVDPPPIDPGSAAARAIEMYDKDGDGAIGGTELDAVPGIKVAMERIDKDGDQKASEEEIKERIEAWQETQVALMTYSCVVTFTSARNPQPAPLKGATVTYEPEPFLGENVKAATGTSLENGIVTVNIPDEELGGAHCGFYKVRITHDDFTIPEKYNTKTILGDEVAQDAQAGEELTRVFELQF